MSEKCTCKLCGTTLGSEPVLISHKGCRAYLCDTCTWEVQEVFTSMVNAGKIKNPREIELKFG